MKYIKLISPCWYFHPLATISDPSIFLTHLAARVAPQLASKGFDVVDRHRGEHRGNLC